MSDLVPVMSNILEEVEEVVGVLLSPRGVSGEEAWPH